MTCTPYQYVILSTLISLVTIVYLSALFSLETNSSHPTEMSGFSPFSSNPIEDSSIPKGPSLRFLDLNILYSTLFQFTKNTKLLNQQRIAALFFINAGFLILYILGRLTIKVFFTKLREIEYQHIYDRVLNFLLFKVVFLGAVLEPKWDEMFLWIAWLAGIGFLRVLSMLCRDRCEYVCESGTNDHNTQLKLLTFLSLIFIANFFWFTVCLFSFRSMLFLLTFECFTLLLDTIQTLAKYLIHLKDASIPEVWENKDIYLRKTEFFTDAAILVMTLLHYFQIAYIHGISFTLIDAVLFLNIRSVFKSLRRKYQLYKSYLAALIKFKTRFPLASEEDLEKYGDSCAICLEEMKVAQKLPCNHIFHALCLRMWLESHQSCPACRKELKGTDETLSLTPLGLLRRPFSSDNSSNTESLTLQSSISDTSSTSGVDWDRGLGVVNDLRY